jgi:hypothetical protein
MPRGASDLPNDHVEAAANLRAKAHRARLLATGMLDEQAATGSNSRRANPGQPRPDACRFQRENKLSGMRNLTGTHNVASD